MNNIFKCNVCKTKHGMALSSFICCKTSEEVYECFANDKNLARKYNITASKNEELDSDLELDVEGLFDYNESDEDFYEDGNDEGY